MVVTCTVALLAAAAVVLFRDLAGNPLKQTHSRVYFMSKTGGMLGCFSGFDLATTVSFPKGINVSI